MMRNVLCTGVADIQERQKEERLHSLLYFLACLFKHFDLFCLYDHNL